DDRQLIDDGRDPDRILRDLDGPLLHLIVEDRSAKNHRPTGPRLESQRRTHEPLVPFDPAQDAVQDVTFFGGDLAACHLGLHAVPDVLPGPVQRLPRLIKRAVLRNRDADEGERHEGSEESAMHDRAPSERGIVLAVTGYAARTRATPLRTRRAGSR